MTDPIPNVSALRKATVALGVAVRNCDRFMTLEEARDTFFRHYYTPDETCSSATAFAEWLFDPADDLA